MPLLLKVMVEYRVVFGVVVKVAGVMLHMVLLVMMMRTCRGHEVAYWEA